MRSGQLNTPTDLLLLDADLNPQLIDWLWCGIQTKDADIAYAAGLRNPAKVSIRSWFDERLQQGRYLRTEDRLFHIDSVRDFNGQQVELAITATELIGQSATYRPATGDPKPCRVHLSHTAPYLDELGQATDYRTKIEVALIETGRVQVDDQIQLGTDLYLVTAYADSSDDGTVRGLWVERQP